MVDKVLKGTKAGDMDATMMEDGPNSLALCLNKDWRKNAVYQRLSWLPQ